MSQSARPPEGCGSGSGGAPPLTLAGIHPVTLLAFTLADPTIFFVISAIRMLNVLLILTLLRRGSGRLGGACRHRPSRCLLRPVGRSQRCIWRITGRLRLFSCEQEQPQREHTLFRA